MINRFHHQATVEKGRIKAPRRCSHGRRAAVCSLLSLSLLGNAWRALAVEEWTLVSSPDLSKEPAVAAAIEDLRTDGKTLGIDFHHVTRLPERLTRAILVGDADRNPLTAKLVRDSAVQAEPVGDPQGFRISTIRRDGGRLVVVAGGSVVGDVYGLYWLWDRMRVFKRIPDLDLHRVPALGIRLSGARSPADIRHALRHTSNWVSGGNILDLVPWNAEPQRRENRANREKIQSLIDVAHAHRMKFLSWCDEFSYHPSLLEAFGATLDPADPALWKALQAKYRRLFKVLPDLDGVQIRTGELTRVSGVYRPFDIMHDAPESDWPLEKRYRTFVKKMHEVVVGEFGKIYFQRTWVTNATEHHSDPEVFRRTFTADVPTRNLYLSPYMSLADRWYYQPYNPTFNLTGHNMIVLLSTLDYHAHGGVHVFPSFPGQYHQGGLETILSVDDNNLRGVHASTPDPSSWSTASLTAYTVFRLAWDPGEDLRQIAEDFAAIHLGRPAAPDMADILLLSHRAYKDGIYVKPVAESIRGNTLPHLRLTIFPLQGLPELDRGRAHIEWLENTMYGPSKGRIDEALEYLDKGLRAAQEMERRYESVSSQIEDRALAKRIGESLELTRRLVETNNRYVKTCYAYFQYREKHDAKNRQGLAQSVQALKTARRHFMEAPGFGYQLFGIDQLIRNAEEALDDLDRAQQVLAGAPAEDQLPQLIASAQKRHARVLTSHMESATKIARWHGMVDGREVLHVRGDTIRLEHRQADRAHSVRQEIYCPLPGKNVTLLVKDIESRPQHPLVLEQPTEANDFTAKIYLFDRQPGYGRWQMELYYLEKSPQELGIVSPWQR